MRRLLGLCCVALWVVGCSGKTTGNPTGAGGGTGGEAGGAGGSGGGSDPTVQVDALHVTSFPLRYGQVSSPWSYHPFLSKSGEAVWALKSGPSGATFDNGQVSWTPVDGQSGTASFTLSAALGGQDVEQSFTVDVSQKVVQASTEIDPNNSNGASLSVDAPLSPIKGSAVVLPPGALGGQSGNVELSISSVSNAPLPLAAQLAGLTSDDLRPVEFGPTGLAFSKPITIYIPLSEKLRAQSNVDVQTYNFASGRWENVQILSIDRTAGVAVAQVSHFSLYTATASTPALTLKVNAGPTACAQSLFVQAPVAVKFDDIPVEAVNGASAAGSTVSTFLANLAVGEALQIQTVVSATSSDATASATAWTLLSATKLTTGGFKVQAASSSQPAAAFLNVPAEVALADVEEWLNGSRVDFLLPGLAGGATGTATAALYYLPSGANPLAPPLVAGNALGRSESFIESAPIAVGSYDDDCDGAPNDYDSTPNGTPPPTVQPQQQGIVHVKVGDSVQLSVVSNATVFSWHSSDTSLGVTASSTGTDATAVGTAVGAFSVSVEATLDSVKSSASFSVVVDPQAVQNTAPRVALAASPSLVVREGEAIRLTALSSDAEQSGESIAFRWHVTGTGALSAATGAAIDFKAISAGDYTVEVVGNDGALDSAPATLVLSVLPAQTNRAPEPPVVTPLSVLLEHAPGNPVTQHFVASALDPDGDLVSYRFELDPNHPSNASFSPQDAEATLTAYDDGSYFIDVQAVDAKGATSSWTRVRVQVSPKLPPAPVDSDKDGYPSTVDCDDSNAKVFPGAAEVCGDAVDQDCNGSDLPTSSCDLDKDRYTPDQGDCDDANPSRNPGMAERCDGVDNNCDSAVDEGYGLLSSCSVGVGACVSGGQTACNASGTGAICAAAPKAPAAETCNGLDDDCNGRIDDVSSGSSSTDVNNCGGCGVVCKALAHMVAQCLQGGCKATCAAGFVDADKDGSNGCECQPNSATNGFEICNGKDDNCNGAIDEGTAKPYYSGPTGSENKGSCRPGLMVCLSGQLVVSVTESLPQAELCDGKDNNCDGTVDEAFPLSSDPLNCGACNRNCGPGGVCDMGRCVTPGSSASGDSGVAGPSCPFGSVLCNGACARVSDDVKNCGGCGVVCASGSFCGAGQCVVPPNKASSCPPDSVTCSSSSATYCAWASLDPLNCGGCGKACPAGNACVSGQCQPAAGVDAGVGCGPFDRCGPMCTSLQHDQMNCGACGASCGAGFACFGGACQQVQQPDAGQPSCPASAAVCNKPGGAGSFCTDTRYDPTNCGVCGNACPSAAPACFNGQCQQPAPIPDGGVSCPTTASQCQKPGGAGNYCTDLRYDSMNCGACGAACSSSAACNNGMCQQPPDGGTACPGNQCTTAAGGQYCTDFRFDVMNCGGCGKACGAGLTCNNGLCQPVVSADGGFVCGSFQAKCSSATGQYCADLRQDLMNCGLCAKVCAAGSTCNNGLCQGPAVDAGVSCGAGFAACGTSCVDVAHDPINCGACGKVCASGLACNNGLCQAPPDGGSACGSNMLSCNKPTGGWYCTDPKFDPQNCGGCGKACPAAQACFNGACQAPPAGDGGAITCSAPQAQCLDMTGKPFCTDPKFDPMNCGGCGRPCGPGQACNNGACQTALPPGDGGSMSCPTTMAQCMDLTGHPFCTDPSKDPMNCGGCAKQCAAGQACNAGVCQTSTTPPPVDGGVVSCPPSLGQCLDPTGKAFCADFGFDSMNCGGCGHACTVGSVCAFGACSTSTPAPDGGTMSCPSTLSQCVDPTGHPFCTDPSKDPMNCGGCGHACGSSQACFNGLCQTAPPPVDGGMTCPTTMAQCLDPSGQAFCADPSKDPMNCGGCGRMCGAGEGCFGSVCQPLSGPADGGAVSCPTYMAQCADQTGHSFCTDTKFDPMNCGGCGMQCGAGQGCFNSMCQTAPPPVDGGTVSCPSYMSQCLGQSGQPFCTDPSKDSMNCGACGVQCGAGFACLNGSCSTATPPADGGSMSCPPNLAQCTDPAGHPVCSDTKFDTMNCGACGVQCAPGYSCNMSACQPQQPLPDGGAMSCPTYLAQCADPSGQPFCTDTKYDPSNCGACGVQCGAGLGCNMGSCQPQQPPSDGGTVSCPPSMAQCSDPAGHTVCTDIKYDSMNCGDCGVQCAPGFGCFNGSCQTSTTPPADGGAVSCPPYLAQCVDTAGNFFCTDTKFDPSNCGGCGFKCGPSDACNMGVCQPQQPPADGGSVSCPTFMAQCSDPAGHSYCTDTKYDPSNCGGCGVQCGAGQGCFNGACMQQEPPNDGGFTSCPSYLISCLDSASNTYCADPRFDQLNCGGCGKPCAQGESCNMGMCQAQQSGPDGGGVSCPPQMAQCFDPTGNSYCADPRFDQMNCGACGHQCSPGAMCNNGMCQTQQPPPTDGGAVSCPPYLAQCSGPSGQSYCADTKFDSMNCGACGYACSPSMVCNNGMCQPPSSQPDGGGSVSCPPGALSCGTICADPMHDPMNCGACGNLCEQGSACFNGSCQQVPPPSTDGGSSCPPDLAQCTTPSGNGYCANTQWDSMNCGSCGNACVGGNVCEAGMCKSPPPPSDAGIDCGPALAQCMSPSGQPYCAETKFDSMNCGSCGVICGSGQVCDNGTCQSAPPPPQQGDGGSATCPPQLGQCSTSSGVVCVDFHSDMANCGACGNACGGGTVCINGGCQPPPPPPSGDAGATGCPPNMGQCNGPTGPYCADFKADSMNCGACANVCANGKSCQNNVCQ